MSSFKGGTHINCDWSRGSYQRIRISAGPHRGCYVDTLILEAKLGRPLAPGMTVEHIDGNTFNFGIAGSNLKEVTASENVKLMHERRSKRTGRTPRPDPAPVSPTIGEA